MSKLIMQPGFRVVAQTHAEWQTFENPKIREIMVQLTVYPCLTAIHLSLIFGFFQMSTIPRVFGSIYAN